MNHTNFVHFQSLSLSLSLVFVGMMGKDRLYVSLWSWSPLANRIIKPLVRSEQAELRRVSQDEPMWTL